MGKENEEKEEYKKAIKLKESCIDGQQKIEIKALREMARNILEGK